MLIIPKDKEQARPQLLDCLNWPDKFAYKPEVTLTAWHSSKLLHLKYKVKEQSVRAEETVPGNAVFHDSCVEFFFKPFADDPHYYNFEWNAIGTVYLAYRTGRHDPENAPAEVLSKVKAISSLDNAPFAERKQETEWTLDIEIPVEALWHAGLETWDGLKASANFYKCGDALAVPHYVTWAPISTEGPDYHRSEFFAPVEFE